MILHIYCTKRRIPSTCLSASFSCFNFSISTSCMDSIIDLLVTGLWEFSRVEFWDGAVTVHYWIITSLKWVNTGLIPGRLLITDADMLYMYFGVNAFEKNYFSVPFTKQILVSLVTTVIASFLKWHSLLRPSNKSMWKPAQSIRELHSFWHTLQTGLSVGLSSHNWPSMSNFSPLQLPQTTSKSSLVSK